MKGESIEREEKGDWERWPSRSAFSGRGSKKKGAVVEKRKKISESYYLGIEKRKQEGERKKELVFLVWFRVE